MARAIRSGFSRIVSKSCVASAAIQLARAVQSRIVRSLHTVDRGVKPALFTVLRAADCPAVLIETAFLSNAVDRVLLTTPQFQQLFAAAIAAAVNDNIIP